SRHLQATISSHVQFSEVSCQKASLHFSLSLDSLEISISYCMRSRYQAYLANLSFFLLTRQCHQHTTTISHVCFLHKLLVFSLCRQPIDEKSKKNRTHHTPLSYTTLI